MPQYPEQLYMTIKNSPALCSPGCLCLKIQQISWTSRAISSYMTGQRQKLLLSGWKENVRQNSINPE